MQPNYCLSFQKYAVFERIVVYVNYYNEVLSEYANKSWCSEKSGDRFTGALIKLKQEIACFGYSPKTNIYQQKRTIKNVSFQKGGQKTNFS